MGNRIRGDHRILITGGGGYLGFKLAERLAQHGCIIFLVDISFGTLSISLGQENENIRLKKMDLTDETQVNESIDNIKPDFVFHFASIIDRKRDFSIYDKLYEVNVKGTLNLLDALKNTTYKGFYFSSTSEVYGLWKGLPFKEDDSLYAVSPYSLTKIYTEKAIELFSNLHNKPYTIFRIFNFYGWDMPPSTFVGQMIEAATKREVFEMTNGEQARDLLFIDELIDQINFVIDSDSNHSVFNLCSGRAIKMIDIVKAYKRTHKNFEYRTNLPYRENEVWETKGDNSRLKSLGYRSLPLSIEDSFKKHF